MSAPEITWLSPDTVQVRQPKSSHWEAPFLFLLFGRERALLIDTGATNDEAVFSLRATIDRLTAEWLRRNPAVFTRPYPLVVAHSHAHRDHIAGDPLLAGRPGTTLVGTTPAQVISFFGFRSWPEETVEFSLGRRTVDVIGGPGHEPSAVAFFDRETGILFSGDTVLPGHLYVRDRAQYRATIERLIRFRDAPTAPVRELRGAHVEMSDTPGVIYPPGTLDQPDELPLALPPRILDRVLSALDEAGDEPGARVVRRRFVLVDE
ncbi:MBL fold metallo-hydrolase [Leifsonia shinshuensis]|uniref:MBL fold metallo-hydrolase n=1 Tax=Leifsonia shinshuensis TaxID=150026 RepID=A0A7G6YFC2_9MICO|nr:MBL fold metallo-hydrolase [Leifsonia shinshuensis]QNE37187.1 MBL fold metallo-hydrolase [Leifsonia shinshuensis]